ncbi:DUF6958 family protein [Thermoflavifilum thermophilum]|uniref:Uncharacterized protein n=1 Tax=Thermoflavifilum thermophilum TaxID=1393122 RepID=A0A1I7NI37_9BACT|nr:hypothetical protein [Thermoflavifilum thermophilum]SFV34304.1 hypothetical protein SAMN05660895_1960 [Thermoflavifilum thermophilum]
MGEKIQLKHPAGKKAISMDKEKYEIIKTHFLAHLKEKGPSTHTELLRSITNRILEEKIKFTGSIEWHMEWVKLDLEANKIIKRMGDKPPIKFALIK